jgi:hypothetical protein
MYRTNINRLLPGSDVILTSYWPRAGEVPLNAADAHKCYLQSNVACNGTRLDRHVITNCACQLPALDPRLCLLPLYAHSVETIVINVCRTASYLLNLGPSLTYEWHNLPLASLPTFTNHNARLKFNKHLHVVVTTNTWLTSRIYVSDAWGILRSQYTPAMLCRMYLPPAVLDTEER